MQFTYKYFNIKSGNDILSILIAFWFNVNLTLTTVFPWKFEICIQQKNCREIRQNTYQQINIDDNFGSWLYKKFRWHEKFWWNENFGNMKNFSGKNFGGMQNFDDIRNFSNKRNFGGYGEGRIESHCLQFAFESLTGKVLPLN